MKRKPFGARLIAGMEEGLLALKTGKALVMIERPSLPRPPAFTRENVVSLRSSFGFTQKEFSELVMVSPKTIQSWEQGTRKPSGTALRMLQVLKSPEALEPITRFRAAKLEAKSPARNRIAKR